MLSEIGLRGLAHGNLTHDAAVQLARDLESALKPPPQEPHSADATWSASSSVSSANTAITAITAITATTAQQQQQPRTYQQLSRPRRLDPLRCPSERVVCLPPGSNVRVAFHHPNPSEANSALLLLFLGGQLGAHDFAALSLLAQVHEKNTIACLFLFFKV